MARFCLRVFALVLLAVASRLSGAEPELKFTRTEDVIYGRKVGTALTLDIFRPEKPNGLGVLFIQSGGWISDHTKIAPDGGAWRPLLRHGYTVFVVVHGSRPKFDVTEMIPDLHRSVRFVRSRAGSFGIDPDRLGLVGGSAGGHLSLMIATTGGPGDPHAADPIDRASSAVQAVAVLFPPTDFLNYGQAGEDGVGVGRLQNYHSAFGPRAETPEGRQSLGREISPVRYLTAKLPPVLIIHGDADVIVPLQQSELFAAKATEVGATVKLIVRPGLGHGWKPFINDLDLFAQWFDEQLKPGT